MILTDDLLATLGRYLEWLVAGQSNADQAVAALHD
jgi:hypothetical protein